MVSESKPCLPRVLFVDDEVDNCEVFQRCFRKQVDVYTAGSGTEALSMMSEMAFPIIICDQRMPGMMGTEVLAEVRRRYPDTIRMLVTAFADYDAIVSAINEGQVTQYFRKPWDTHDVLAAINQASTLYEQVQENRRLLRELSEANEVIATANRDLEAKVLERTRQLEELTLTDEVTGLFNQRFLHSRLAEELRRATRYRRPLALIMLDLDHFKRVNDTHDHLFGSRVLARVGELLKSTVRDVDRVVRYGGDEFVIIMPETEGRRAVEVAERLRAEIEAAQVGAQDTPCQLTASIGVSALDLGEFGESDQLLKAADSALYASKKGGRNSVFVATAGELVLAADFSQT